MSDTSLVFNVLAKDKASAVLSRVGGSVKAMSVAAAAGLTLLASQSVAAASNLNETQSKIGVIFGKSAASVLKFGDTAATSFGQSKQAALDGAATFAVYGKGAGLAGERLVTFSTDLTKLASDMASFSNTSPEEAIQAIGAALRGESDPIERYGVLLNESVVKQQALRMGLIKTTTAALTPQQRVLAATAAIYAQTRDAQGDFARTSSVLANQQRILTAQWADFKTQLGTALLPVVTQFVTLLTARVMPALMDLWARHGPAVTQFLSRAAGDFGGLVGRLEGFDWRSLGADIGAVFGKLGPALSQVKTDLGPGFADTIKVSGVVFGFLADNADLLVKALPFLAAGFLLVKAAQVAANVAAAVSPALRVAEVIANTRLAASQRALTASLIQHRAALVTSTGAEVAHTVARNAGDVAAKRSIVTTTALAVKQKVVAAATAIWTAAQYLLAGATWASLLPILLVIAVIAIVVGVIVLIATKTTWFQTIWRVAWGGIKTAAEAVWRWITDTLWPGIRGVWDRIAGIAVGVFQTWRTNLDKVISFVAGLPGRISSAARGMWDGLTVAFRSAVNWILRKWNALSFTLPPISIPGIGQVWGGMTLSTPDIPLLARGGAITGSGIAVVGERGPEVVHLERGAQVAPLRGQGGMGRLALDSSGSRLDDLLLEVLRRAVRNRGGDVQLVLGR